MVAWDVLLYAVELVELATRFVSDLHAGGVVIDVALVHVAGRELTAGDWTRELRGPYMISADRLDSQARLSSAQLLADPRGVALALTQRRSANSGSGSPTNRSLT